MPNVQLHCETCGLQAKRALLEQVGCRGVHETASEPASCPAGHGLMVRTDGHIQKLFNGMWVVTRRKT